MKTQKIILFSLLIGLSLMSAKIMPASATTASAMVLSIVSGDIVQIHVTGSPNSTVQFYFYAPSASLPTNMTIGTTDGSGNFSTTISSGAYGIPAGVQCYVIVNGQQSSAGLWPSYTSLLALNQTTAQLSVGQSLVITSSNTSSNPAIISYNSNSSALSTSANINQITLTGNVTGSGTLTICGATLGCKGLTFSVGSSTSSTSETITFSQNNISLNKSQSMDVTIYSSLSPNGFNIYSNNNPTAISASISGTSNIINLYGENAGSTTITICTKANSSICSSIYITVSGGSSASAISFSQNTISLNYGQSTTITASGDPNNSYFVSNNSNPTIISVGISSNSITIAGGSSTGSGTIAICSTTSTSICNNIYVTISTNASGTTVSFTSNNITINNTQNMSLSIYGGSGSNYFIYSNSNPNAVTATISSNTLYLTGNSTLGSATINVCSATVGSSCANLYVTDSNTTTSSTITVSLSQTSISLNPAQTSTITASGDSTNNYYASSNSNANVVNIKIDGSTIYLNGGNTAGTSIINICSSSSNSSCATLIVTTTSYNAPLTFSQNVISLTSGQTTNVIGYYSGTSSGGLFVSYNSNPNIVTAKMSGNNIIALTAGSSSGSGTVSICSSATTSDCANLYITNSTSSTPSPTPSPTPTNTDLENQLAKLQAQLAALLQSAATSTGSNSTTPITTSYKFYNPLKFGSTGKDVTELQKRLNTEGIYSGPITGYYGSLTQTAIKKYQEKHGLATSGKSGYGNVGPATRAFLNK